MNLLNFLIRISLLVPLILLLPLRLNIAIPILNPLIAPSLFLPEYSHHVSVTIAFLPLSLGSLLIAHF